MSAEGKRPKVSVIIPCKDDEERLHTCLSCLAAQTYPLENIEVIVADDGSDSPISTPDLPGLSVKVIKLKNAGSYVARNAAFAQSNGDILAFTDSDCRPDPEWLSEGVKAVEKYKGLAAGHVRVEPEDYDHVTPVEAYEMLTAFPQKLYVSQGYSVTANLLATRNVYETAGGFDETLKSGGDFDWCHRAGKAGFEIHFVPEAVVAHPARKTYAQLRMKHLRIAAGLHANERGKHSLRISWGKRVGRLLNLTVPPVMTVIRIIRSPRIKGVSLKLATTITAIRIRYLRAFEGWRLFFGGKYRW